MKILALVALEERKTGLAAPVKQKADRYDPAGEPT